MSFGEHRDIDLGVPSGFWGFRAVGTLSWEVPVEFVVARETEPGREVPVGFGDAGLGHILLGDHFVGLRDVRTLSWGYFVKYGGLRDVGTLIWGGVSVEFGGLRDMGVLS